MEKFLALFIFLSFSTINADEAISTINYSIVMKCPPSIERETLESIIPPSDYQSPTHEEWIRATVNELEHLIAFVQSGHFTNAGVTFESNNKTQIDLSNLAHANLSLHFLCKDSQELRALKLAETKDEGENKLSYLEWSAQAMGSLQDLQMLILKGKVVLVQSQQLVNESENGEELTEVKCNFDVRGPLSHEFQALLDAIPEESANLHEWSIAMVHAMHKLELLILSGKINVALVDMHVN